MKCSEVHILHNLLLNHAINKAIIAELAANLLTDGQEGCLIGSLRVRAREVAKQDRI
jgi:hypothetical protein